MFTALTYWNDFFLSFKAFQKLIDGRDIRCFHADFIQNIFANSIEFTRSAVCLIAEGDDINIIIECTAAESILSTHSKKDNVFENIFRSENMFHADRYSFVRRLPCKHIYRLRMELENREAR